MWSNIGKTNSQINDYIIGIQQYNMLYQVESSERWSRLWNWRRDNVKKCRVSLALFDNIASMGRV